MISRKERTCYSLLFTGLYKFPWLYYFFELEKVILKFKMTDTYMLSKQEERERRGDSLH